MANIAAVAADDYDRTKEVEEFDNSKAGVKGLLDAGVTTIPRIFHHPGAGTKPSSNPSLSIPTVDLSLPRARVIELARAACREWGFFRLVNHGVPQEAISAVLSAVQAFNELPAEAKTGYYSRKLGGRVTYNSNFDLHHSDVASWRDTLQVVMAPGTLDAEQIPEVCRRELLEWDEHAQGVAKRLLGLLSEGLGVEAGRLEEKSCMELRVLVSHYYPYCPQPELTLGHDGHTDIVVLTVLVTNEVEGLMVRKEGGEGDGEWVMVEPIPGTIIVNVGDTLQMVSNDEYQSVEHKVAANPHKKARVSIAAFYAPANDHPAHLGPLPELISEEKPARYREFTMAEALGIFASKKLVTNSLINHFKI